VAAGVQVQFLTVFEMDPVILSIKLLRACASSLPCNFLSSLLFLLKSKFKNANVDMSMHSRGKICQYRQHLGYQYARREPPSKPSLRHVDVFSRQQRPYRTDIPLLSNFGADLHQRIIEQKKAQTG
jgi:hypothetical protein